MKPYPIFVVAVLVCSVSLNARTAKSCEELKSGDLKYESLDYEDIEMWQS